MSDFTTAILSMMTLNSSLYLAAGKKRVWRQRIVFPACLSWETGYTYNMTLNLLFALQTWSQEENPKHSSQHLKENSSPKNVNYARWWHQTASILTKLETEGQVWVWNNTRMWVSFLSELFNNNVTHVWMLVYLSTLLAGKDELLSGVLYKGNTMGSDIGPWEFVVLWNVNSAQTHCIREEDPKSEGNSNYQTRIENH